MALSLLKLMVVSLFLTLIFTAIAFGIIASSLRNLPESAGTIVFELGHRYPTKGGSYDNRLDVDQLRPTSIFLGQQFETLLDPYSRFQASEIYGLDCAPDGQSLLFYEPYLYQLDLRSDTLTQLTFFPRDVFALASAPDQKQIALIESQENSALMSLSGAHADGTKLSAIYFPLDVYISLSIAWSPDSRQIAFGGSYATGDQSPVFDLETVDVSTHAIRQIYQAPEAIDHVTWSPDGTRIAFEMFNQAHSAIYTIHPDGSGLTLLTHDERQSTNPRWSPDGSLISYSTGGVGEPDQLYVMNADGSDPHSLFLAPGGQEVYNLCWLKA